MVSTRTVDFTNVKEQASFNKRRLPAGDYLGYVSKVEDAEAKDGIFQYLFTIKIKQHSQASFPYYCKIQENQLWKLRNLLVAAGIQVPKKRVKLDPSKVIGKAIGISLEDDEYEGKEQSNVSAIFPASELEAINTTSGPGSSSDDDEDEEAQVAGDDSEEEEEPEEEPEPEPEDEGDGLDDLDRAGLKAILAAEDIEFKVFKSTTDDAIRDAIRDARGDAATAEEPEEEEEEEPAPPPRKAAAKPAAAKTRTRPAARKAVSDEELEELDISDL